MSKNEEKANEEKRQLSKIKKRQISKIKKGQMSNTMMWCFVQLGAGERSQTFKRQFGAKKGERLTL